MIRPADGSQFATGNLVQELQSLRRVTPWLAGPIIPLADNIWGTSLELIESHWLAVVQIERRIGYTAERR